MLWLALWGGGALTRWDPRTGRLLARHSLPVSQVTSCAFGGANLDILYVTSARDGLTPAQLAVEPLAGAIFALDAGVRGRPGGSFGAELPR
jgi:sugar lactone lactonase YvrE